ncbi:AAA family ATPase [Flavobacterium oreochromis]|uniref:McrB family protein n=1 Tax=Flavobacterium oreochromis TaxID=2906078 RepID=UPI00385F06EF
MKQNLAKLVTKESVLQALKKFETENPYLEPSTKYDLEYNGGYYPPKEVVREAARIQGIEIDDELHTLGGGDKTNIPLRDLGFNIVGKNELPKINLRKLLPQIKKYNDAINNTDWLKVREIYKFNFIKWVEKNIDFVNDSNEIIKQKIELSQEQKFDVGSNTKGINFLTTIKRFNDDYLTIDDIALLKRISNKELEFDEKTGSFSFNSYPKASLFLSLFYPEKFCPYDGESLPSYEYLKIDDTVAPKKGFKAFYFYQIFYFNTREALKQNHIDTDFFKQIFETDELTDLHWNWITQDFLLYISRNIMNTNNAPAYYCVGFHFYSENPTNQLPRFIENKIWENGYDDKFTNIVNEVPIGALIAAKTSYTMNEYEKTISVLEVHCIGKVISNFKNGKTLQVEWEKNFEPFVLKRKGAYRSTISRVHNQDNINAIFYNRDEANMIVEELDLGSENISEFPLNQILFGAPGTGKTYTTKKIAIEIIDNQEYDENDRKIILDRYDELVKSNQIHFTTFHQSMSYEDFIEGIKPETIDNRVTYEVKDGMFKRLAQLASKEVSKTINKKEFEEKILLFDDAWNGLIEETQKALDNGFSYIINTITNKELEIKAISNQGNLIIQPKVDNALEYTISYNRTKRLFETFPDLKEIKNIDKDFRTVIGGSNSTAYWSVLNYIHIFLNENSSQNEPLIIEPPRKYVIIIDEINRGNVSAIFGELITLIEDDKRKAILNKKEEFIEVELPYSGDKFSVPDNLYIIGTMNTADRSVESLDTALRRRFSFLEMPSKPEKLVDVTLEDAEEIDLEQLLDKINQRIELLIDKDHQIGHSFFINLKDLNGLKTAFKNKIIPLLEEYFFGDFGKIGLVLGENFISVKNENNNSGILAKFSAYEEVDFITEKKVYQIKNCNELKAQDFISIYE